MMMTEHIFAWFVFICSVFIYKKVNTRRRVTRSVAEFKSAFYVIMFFR